MACWEEWTLESSVVASSPLYGSDYGATQYDHALLSYPVSFERVTIFFVYLPQAVRLDLDFADVSPRFVLCSPSDRVHFEVMCGMQQCKCNLLDCGNRDCAEFSQDYANYCQGCNPVAGLCVTHSCSLELFVHRSVLSRTKCKGCWSTYLQ